MAKESYSIPTTPNAFNSFQRGVINAVVANATAWGIPNETVTKLTKEQSDFEKSFIVAENRSTQSPMATATRNADMEILKNSLISLFNHELLNNEAISVADKEILHINAGSKGGGTSTPAPTTTPVVNMAAKGASVLLVNYYDSATPSTAAKPNNVVFCEMAYKLDQPIPNNPDECTQRCNISRSHEGIIFPPEQRGKTIYAFARWVNRNGKVGPWSGMVTAIIP